MNSLKMVGAGIGLLLYLLLAGQIMLKNVEQNLATFLLWTLLDAIAAISTFYKGGNWYLPGFYALGGAIVFASLLVKRLASWTWFETLISIMVIVCLVGWAISGDATAIVLSTLGVVLAGIPQCREAYRKPGAQPFLVYAGFFAANGLSVLGGRAWTIEERFYSSACFLLTVAVVWPLVSYRIKHRIPLREWI